MENGEKGGRRGGRQGEKDRKRQDGENRRKVACRGVCMDAMLTESINACVFAFSPEIILAKVRLTQRMHGT